MEKRLYRVTPILEERPWGGQMIREKYQYQSDLKNLAQVYLAIAIPGHLDNEMDTGEKLSDFYHDHPELFRCKAKDFPVRFAIANSAGKLSYHLHPPDAYALEHEGMRSKVEGSVAIENTGEEYVCQVGHTAKTKEEFVRLLEAKDFDTLLGKKVYKEGEYHHCPYCTLHGGGSDEGAGRSISVSWSTNGDVTYRIYDHDRNDPDRPLHIRQVLDVLDFPDHEVEYEQPVPYENDGCLTYDYYSVPGQYVARRIKTKEHAKFSMDEFMFIFCGDGNGSINGEPVKAGDTVFVPAGFGELSIEGKMDLFIISYIDGRADAS